MAKKVLSRKSRGRSATSQRRSTGKSKPKRKALAKKKIVKKKKPAKRQAKKAKRAPQKSAKKKTTKKKGGPKSAARKKKTTTKKKPSRRSTQSSLESTIRRFDRELLRLINKRATATTKYFASLPDADQAVFDPATDDELWRQLADNNPGPLPTRAVQSVFREIVSAARREVKPLRVAYLGPSFSFTHLAAIERFGKWADLSPVSTIASVFEEVNRGHANYGLVPIENSTDGRVIDTLNMFTRLPLRICGEVQISVHHNLMARCQRGEITEVYSKPQALSQCRDWLARNMPQARLIEVTSTSTAAQLARDKPGAAAVASQQASVEYGLQIIADDIEDAANNVTRFAVIGDEVSRPTGRDRTALLMQIPHKPGALSDSLSSFKRNRINLTWIESFPLRGPESGYLFFLDFEGHVNDARIKRTLADLMKKTVRLEVLGSYPRSEPLD